ncbi:MAG TPA: helicase-related protein, partial [Casimicrobiaceae bacterium]|nr:helicase-related protein [Casimicrobiaceae bacterium]
KDGLVTSAIHGDRTQAARLEALAAFKDAKLEILVATDVAARGLDIDDLPLVVNYELPHVPEDYIHRIGRTGRAGATGEAISLVDPAEMKYLTEIEKLLKKTIPISTPEGIDLARPAGERRERRERGRPAGEAPRERAERTPSALVPRTPRAPRAERTQRNERPAGESRATREAEREAAYAKNPDQPMVASAPAVNGSRPAAPLRRGFGAHQPVPALLMKRPSAPAPSAHAAPTADAAPSAAPETERA